MKKTLLLLSLVTTVFFISCKNSTVKGTNGVTYTNPSQYNDYIVTKQTEVMKNIMAFGQQVGTAPGEVLTKLPGYASEAEAAIKDIKGMPAYNDNTQMRDAAVDLFSFYADIFKNEYRQMAELAQSLSNTPATPEQTQEIQKLVDQVASKESVLDRNFQKAQKDFAKKNNLVIQENEMQKEIDKLND